MKVKGFTLFELLFVSGLSVLMAGLALPGFKHLRSASMIEAEAFTLMGFIQTGRKEAISKSKNVVLCGSQDGTSCDKDWSNGILLFVDSNNDNQFTGDTDTLIQYHQFEKDSLKVSWNSFRGTKPIRFLSAGITWHNNGTFVICHNNDPRYAKALFLAKSGRVEMSKDENQDGIDELRDETPINC